MQSIDIRKTAEALLAFIDDNEKISLPMFAAKLEKVSSMYPEDQTIGVMSDIVDRMSNSKLSISRKEVKDLYNKLYQRNTKFASLFADELGIKIVETPIAKTASNNETITTEQMFESTVDPVLSNALSGVFGGPTSAYSKVHAERSKIACRNAFAAFGMSPIVEVVNGTDQIVVCRASFETPKGTTSVLVPVRFDGNNVYTPDAFVGNLGPSDLNKSAIRDYVLARAGEKLMVDANMILKTCVNAFNTNNDISEVDLALTKLNASKEKVADLSQGNIIGQVVEEDRKDLEVIIPTYQDDEINAFAKQFDNALGVATFQFGKDKVNNGRHLIATRLNTYGLTNHQISVCDCDDKSITYAVALNSGKVAFKVPVKVADGKVYAPTIMIANGSVNTLSNDTINELFANKADYKTAASASLFATYKAYDLVNVIKHASANHDYAKAEEALNVLSSFDNPAIYKEAFENYISALSGNKPEISQCKMKVKSSTSNELICGHTGLVLSKTYTDKNGNCQPNYRRNMSETYDGAYLQNHKVLF
jgi:hypothetical protein